jgi:hypothetical protein
MRLIGRALPHIPKARAHIAILCRIRLVIVMLKGGFYPFQSMILLVDQATHWLDLTYLRLIGRVSWAAG